MTNVTATASGGGESHGVENFESSPTITQSTLSGDNSLVQTGSTAKVADTQLIGPIVEEGDLDAVFQCFGNYDENMDAVTCPAGG